MDVGGYVVGDGDDDDEEGEPREVNVRPRKGAKNGKPCSRTDT